MKIKAFISHCNKQQPYIHRIYNENERMSSKIDHITLLTQALERERVLYD